MFVPGEHYLLKYSTFTTLLNVLLNLKLTEKMKFYLLPIIGFPLLGLIACEGRTQKAEKKIILVQQTDTIDHGYNELANSEKRETFAVSDYNTDNPAIKNIDRPAQSTVSTDLDTALLFNIWTSDPEGPHADFVFSGKSFFVVDYDGNGDMPYELTGRKLKVYYNDFIQEGDIVSVDKDSLKIRWNDVEGIANYTRWKN
jgi:hypothetical protein